MPKKPSNKSSIITRKQKKAAADISEYGGAPSNAEFATEYLESPNKSDSDPTEYRVIKLPNGLVVTLMSAHQNPSEHNEGDPSVNREMDPKCKPPGSNKSEGTTESTRAKIFMELEHMILDAAHCSLSINVGSFSDSPNMPFISSILRRAILISSQKYSQENSFETFLKTCNGSAEISPDTTELTYFSFKVPLCAFAEALDRFSNCFANPCLRRPLITKFWNALTMDPGDALLIDESTEKKRRLVMSFMSKNNPEKTGLKRVNRKLSDRLGEGVYEEVEAFMKRHYSAHRMKVVLQATLPLDELETYARKYFSRLPTNGLPPVDLSSYSVDQCFNMRAFNMVHLLKPDRDLQKDTIDFYWIMPSDQKHYRTNPIQYIASMFNNDLPGSLSHYLRERDWGITSQISKRNNGFRTNSLYYYFVFDICLTPAGKQNLKKVLDAVYSFINFLKEKGTEKHVYDEARRIAEARFRVDADNRVAQNAKTLRESMHLFRSADYLTGDSVYQKYDPKVIKTFLDCLSPEKNLIFMTDDETMRRCCLSDDADSGSEDEGKGMFMRMRLSKKWINDWKTIKPLPCFKFPEPNIFCPDDFSLVPIPREISKFPVKIHSDSAYEVWHQSNGTYRSPVCTISLHYLTDIPLQSVESSSMIEALAICLRRLMMEKFYLARVAGMQFRIRPSAGKLLIELTGTRHNLALLVQTIGEFIGNCSVLITEKILSDGKDDMLSFWHEKTNAATAILSHDVEASILLNIHWTLSERLTASSKITLESFKNFAQHFTKNGYVRSLVSGNIEASDALDIVRHFTAILKCGPRKAKTPLTRQILELPRGSQYCRVQRLYSKRNYHCVMNHYQLGKYSLTKAGALALLLALHDDPIFARIRLSNRISNIEIAMSKYLQGSALIGYYMLARNYNSAPDFVGDNIRIEAYRHAFKTMLEKLSTVEWEILRLSIVKSKRSPTRLSQDATNEAEVSSAQFGFDRNQQQAEAIARLSTEELSKLVIGMVKTDENTRKLSVQVIGHVASGKEQQELKASSNNFEWKLVTEPTSNWEYDNFITDISAFKRDLKTVSDFEE